jgi:hypothetical protein
MWIHHKIGLETFQNSNKKNKEKTQPFCKPTKYFINHIALMDKCNIQQVLIS